MKKIVLLTFSVIMLKFSSFSQSLHFDGLNDYVQTTASFSGTTAKVTYECWVKSSSAPDTLIGMDGPMYGHAFGILWDHAPAFYKSAYVLDSNSNYRSASFGNLAANTWYHLAATYDGLVLKAYVNGVLISSTTTTGGIHYLGSPNLKLGCHPYNGIDFFEGQIDEVRVWNVARTCEEINQNMNVVLNGNETGLVAYYQLNEGTPFANNSSVTLAYNKVSSTYDANLTNFALSGTSSNYVSNSPMNAVLNSCSTSIDEQFAFSLLKVYPNPTSSVLNIEVKEQTQITIVNVLGEVVKAETINGLSTIDVSELNNGVYFIQTNTGINTKFIKN